MSDRQHEWIPSRLGHGNKMCKVCFMTDLEAEALGLLFQCDGGETVVAFRKATEKK